MVCQVLVTGYISGILTTFVFLGDIRVLNTVVNASRIEIGFSGGNLVCKHKTVKFKVVGEQPAIKYFPN